MPRLRILLVAVLVAVPVPVLVADAAVGAAGAVPAVARDGPVPVTGFGWPLPGLDREAGAGPPPRGTVTRRFVAPPTPYGRGHRGVDLAAAPGTPVLAAGEGVVVFAGPVGGRGVVSVRHAGGLRTTYEPVAATVVVGAPLARGTPLGVLLPGHGGCPAPACLHWGLRRAAPGDREQYLDPLLLVGLGRVRLLPSDPSPQALESSARRARSRITARVWSWQTRDSVTPRTRPISARVRFSK